MFDWQNMIVFGDSQHMDELENESVHLVVTSPPYYNAPFDYPDLFESYEQFKTVIRNVAKELKRVLDRGRIACFVCDDMHACIVVKAKLEIQTKNLNVFEIIVTNDIKHLRTNLQRKVKQKINRISRKTSNQTQVHMNKNRRNKKECGSNAA